MPYRVIAAHLNKTELACRLHYHQLNHGSSRRKRASSGSSGSPEGANTSPPRDTVVPHPVGASGMRTGHHPVIYSVPVSPRRSRHGQPVHRPLQMILPKSVPAGAAVSVQHPRGPCSPPESIHNGYVVNSQQEYNASYFQRPVPMPSFSHAPDSGAVPPPASHWHSLSPPPAGPTFERNSRELPPLHPPVNCRTSPTSRSHPASRSDSVCSPPGTALFSPQSTSSSSSTFFSPTSAVSTHHNSVSPPPFSNTLPPPHTLLKADVWSNRQPGYQTPVNPSGMEPNWHWSAAGGSSFTRTTPVTAISALLN